MVANKVMDNTAKRSTDDVGAIIDDVQLPTACEPCQRSKGRRPAHQEAAFGGNIWKSIRYTMKIVWRG